jgi:hypothetical protein
MEGRSEGRTSFFENAKESEDYSSDSVPQRPSNAEFTKTTETEIPSGKKKRR